MNHSGRYYDTISGLWYCWDGARWQVSKDQLGVVSGDLVAIHGGITDLMRGSVVAPANAPTTASNPGACIGTAQSAQPEPARLYCPAHGKAEMWPDEIDGKRYCPKCVANLLDRSGVHELVEKPPSVKKGW